MQPTISLALTLHNHQLIGNFGWVLAEVYDQAYRPMLDALERHPDVRVGLHYTGPLLDWLEAERPDFTTRLRALVARGQVEVLGGGLYEPILVALPDADRAAQLTRMADRVAALTGVRPRGAWLAERVWEPSLPRALVAAGYEYTILDDNHFRAAALPEEALWGAWRTEDQGSRVTIFGTEQGLRYRIPFGRAEDVIEHLRRHATPAGDRLGTMGDDGEKFGAWPTTFEHCWGSGQWVEQFFSLLEANADWLHTTTPAAWLDSRPARGLAYVPAGSYAEMGEWALPASESRAFGAMLHRAIDEGRPEARWLRGASWRNYLVKYREANDLHKQMERTSRRVHAMAEGPARDRALDHLHRGQSNDCYWHGLFGGLYLTDLRVAALRHLIAAMDLTAGGPDGHPPAGKLADLDADGLDEALLSSAGQVVTVDLAEGAGVGAWDIRAARHPVLAVLRRRPESYHEVLREMEARAAEQAAAAAAAAIQAEDAGLAPAHGGHAADAVRDPGGPASIHDIVAAKEQGLSRHLQYDDHERRFGLVRAFPADMTPQESAAGSPRDLGDFVDAPFRVVDLAPGRLAVARDGQVEAPGGPPQSFRVEKVIHLGGDRRSPELALDLAVEHRGEAAVTARWALELPTMLLGGGGNPAAWWEVDGVRTAHDGSGQAAGVSGLAQGNDFLGLAIRTVATPAADAWWSPLETISNSESGFERVYQGSALVLSWLRTLAPGERFTASVSFRAATVRDAATDEAGAQPDRAGAHPDEAGAQASTTAGTRG